MWMAYASEHWTPAEDLNTAIKRMSEELNCLSFDSAHAAVYDYNYCFFDEEVEKLNLESENYMNGYDICWIYLDGFINLDQFCDIMIKLELKNFLTHLLEYLPDRIIEIYQLKEDKSFSGEHEDSEEIENT